MEDAGAKQEARAEPISHPVWVKDADELTLAPFTQNSGHPRELWCFTVIWLESACVTSLLQ